MLHEVTISGPLLASLCSESPFDGYLYGNRIERNDRTTTDEAEMIETVFRTIHVHSYKSTIDHEESIGIITVRPYNLPQPSFKQYLLAAALAKAQNAPSLVLVISLPESMGNWIYSMRYACYYIASLSTSPIPIEMIVPNLSEVVKSTLADRNTHCHCSTNSSNMHSAVTALAVQQTVLTDAYSYSLLDDIKVSKPRASFFLIPN